MIVVKVYGGLGNQMFQYAFYLYLKKYNDEVYLDISDYKVHKHHHGFELDHTFANLKYDILDGRELKRFRVNPNTLFRRVFNKMFDIQLVHGHEIREHPARMVIEPCTYCEDIYFNGFWANRRYIDEVEEASQIFVFKYEPEGKNRYLFEKIKNSYSVSVHVRRGDFLKDGNIADCCNLSYYQRAFDFFLERDRNSMFVVFSDDIEWARENLTFAKNITYVDWNTGENSSRDMQMMSLCKNNIIANSTFSWWGGRLNANSDKLIIAPKIWSKRKKGMSPIIYEDWILL